MIIENYNFSLKAVYKIFGASNILFDAYKIEWYNDSDLALRRTLNESML